MMISTTSFMTLLMKQYDTEADAHSHLKEMDDGDHNANHTDDDYDN